MKVCLLGLTGRLGDMETWRGFYVWLTFFEKVQFKCIGSLEKKEFLDRSINLRQVLLLYMQVRSSYISVALAARKTTNS